MKKTWGTIKEVLCKNRKNTNFPGKFFFKNESYTGDEQIANKFNEFFSSIGKKIADELTTNILCKMKSIHGLHLIEYPLMIRTRLLTP